MGIKYKHRTLVETQENGEIKKRLGPVAQSEHKGYLNHRGPVIQLII